MKVREDSFCLTKNSRGIVVNILRVKISQTESKIDSECTIIMIYRKLINSNSLAA